MDRLAHPKLSLWLTGGASGGKGSPGVGSCPRGDPGYELSLAVCFLQLLKTSGGHSKDDIRLGKPFWGPGQKTVLTGDSF